MICPKCDTEVRNSANHCPHCGAAFVRVVEERRPKDSTFRWFLNWLADNWIIALILGMALASGIGALLKKH